MDPLALPRPVETGKASAIYLHCQLAYHALG